MKIYLTDTGWTDDTTGAIGTWTDGNDVVTGINDRGTGVQVDGWVNANTLTGDDSITGWGYDNTEVPSPRYPGIAYRLGTGISNKGTINTGDGNNSITGAANGTGISNKGTINTGDGNNSITGAGEAILGISNTNSGTINTGGGDDSITGIVTGLYGVGGISNSGTINTGGGNDGIIGIGGMFDGIFNIGTINTGDGDDFITGINYDIYNNGIIYTGNGNDSITGAEISNYAGNGNDSITGTEISNSGTRGTVDTGDGNDIVTATKGFYGNGIVFLGSGDDTLSGFGSGFLFDGGPDPDYDTLILPSGSYSVGSTTIGENTFVTFMLGDIIMPTTGFEVLNIGGNTYDFASLPSMVFG